MLFPTMNSKQSLTFSSSPLHVHFLYYSLCILIISTTIISTSNIGEIETDRQTLLNIKSMITRDPYGALTSWNNSLHFCNWTGVTCGNRHQRVTYLKLSSQGLQGYLSPHIGNLSFLRLINLGNNSFQGVIPNEIGRLSRLRTLYLFQNKFNGVIPANISGCSNLEHIGFGANELIGSIPKEISYLTKLSFLSLQHNNLTGGIPPCLGNITSMEMFGVFGNPLGGNIPNTLSRWKNIEEIYCSHCNLSGTIDPLYNLSLLTYIHCTNNQLTGSLPLAFGAMFPHLVSLLLWGNRLTGPLPPSISNCSNLTSFQMNKNNFSGKLTIDFSKLRDINFISIGSNNFGSKDVDEMKFIDSMKNSTRLEYLDLSDCNFLGVIPRSIGNLSNQINYLSLEENQLHINIPISIGNLVGLTGLHLESNYFTGSIPSSIGNLKNLRALYLQRNELSRAIPEAIGNLSLLNTLSLFSNKLEGVIPSSIGDCNRLLELYINDNKLYGEIPTKLLQLSSLSITMNLSQNSFSGLLPKEVGDLKMLTSLDFSYNNLSGAIPSSLGDCDSLLRLSLKGNSFQGMIPSSLSSLKGLLELDLSYNNLSGQIPKFLEQLKLEHLNLSYNDFEGKVPTLGVFTNQSAFSILGNSRLCGDVELGLPKCKETKKHNKKFPTFVIVILVASTLFAIICVAYACYKKKIKNQLFKSLLSERFSNVSYNQLFKATNGFSESNLIGSGGFSSVFKGILDEDDVAVKVLHLQIRGAGGSFFRECEAWQNTRHRNLLKIKASCSSIDFQGNEFKALVYEFMPKGSLHDWLHSSDGTSRLNLLQIINILIDVAFALEYIHNHCQPPIIHGDLKPSNILLNDDMVAHVGDFGLARFFGTSYQNNSTGVRGTIGYAAPEYGLGNEMTSSGDIYSFGILILEVLTGKKPTDDMFKEGLSLHNFASMSLPDHVIDVIDVNILNVYQENQADMKKKEANVEKIDECLASIIKIGVSCSLDVPQQQMDIKVIVYELQHILSTLQKIES